MSNPALSADELCPNCGEFFVSLNNETGWCGDCSGDKPHTIQRNNKNESRLEKWLTVHADEIEDLMQAFGLKASDAIREIAAENAPEAICAICGTHIKRTRHQNFFCSSTPDCLKARRYYKYLVYEKNVDKDDAFNRALRKFK